MLYLKVTASLKEMMVISSGVFVTLDRLFHSFYGHVITKNVFSILLRVLVGVSLRSTVVLPPRGRSLA